MGSHYTVYEEQAELDLGIPRLPHLEWPGPGELEPGRLPAARLDGFTTSVFAQAYTEQYQIVRRLMEHTGVGAVLTLRPGSRSRHDRALGPVRELQRHTRTSSMLVDANEYSGKNRKPAVAGIDPTWNHEQHRHLELNWALTNSGYAATIDDVATLVHGGADLAGLSVTAIPIPTRVLCDYATEIADLARGQGHPIALLLEDVGDPFDDPDTAPALVHVIHHSGNPVLVLRCDVSALGAISHGAAVGAVGGPGLRHIYPRTDTDGFAPPLSFVIPELLGYFLQTRFDKAYLRDPGHRAWSCPCWFCAHRDLTWIGNQPRLVVPGSALQHSIAALALSAEKLAAHQDPTQGWTTMCAAAERMHEEIANPSGSAWEPKAALAHWQRVAPVATRA